MKLHRMLTIFTLLCLSLISVACQSTDVDTTEQESTTNDSGISGTIRLSRGNWDTGYFQAAVYEKLLTELGYDVVQTGDLSPELFYIALADGADTDLWANGWIPDHDPFLQDEAIADYVTPVGYQVKAGAIQGYLIDKKTAEEYGITSIEDMKKPEIAALFDKDGDGKADLTGCNAGWGCEKIIESHLETLDLRDSITHVRGEYSLLMTDVIARYEQSEPVFFYTWTPNWTVSKLVPGEDVVWITVPEQEDVAPAIEGVTGCVEDPCSMGFVGNDLRVVANKKWLESHPAAATLLELVEIPITDISNQNQLMLDGEDGEDAILGHATTWIEEHRQEVDNWLEAARAVK